MGASKVVAVDFDEVLAESMRACLAFHNYTICGQDIEYETITYYHLEDNDHLNITTDQAVQWFDDFNEQGQNTVDPVLGAYEKLLERKQQGHTMILVTARPSSLEKQTRGRLDKHFPNIFSQYKFGSIYHSTGITRSKAEMCAEIGADLFIDDNMRYLLDVQNHLPNTQLFLYERPRNHEYKSELHPGITKVSSRSDIFVA